ncbi:MAG TPA: tyrosine-type recombinase/integrase [Tepidisphaeraceae bacterium]|jgi:integrase
MAEKITFTEARLSKAECPAGKDRVYLWDAKQPSFCLMITASGAKSFYVYRRVNGRPERVRLGGFPDLTVDDARDLACETIGKIAGGDNPAEQRRQARGEITLGELFNRWRDEYAKVHKRTWADDESQFERYATPLKDRRLSSIHRRDVQQLHTEVGKSNGEYAANRLLALLSVLFNYAVTAFDYEGGNPAKGVKRFSEQSRERFLDADEMSRFLPALDKHPDQQLADFFRVLLFTGARRSNVQAMAWADVNFGRRVWTIPAEQSKNNKALTVYLSDPAIEALQRRWQERIEDSPYVFPSRGETGHLTEPKAAWKVILAKAKITDFRVHDLRRTHGSWLASGGASLPIIGKALGHKSQQATAVYSRLDLNPVKTVVETATAAMLGTMPKGKSKTTSKRKAG